jgi:2,3-bisphosphoglycerate-independent phosphoglycerate mutase
MNFRSDRAREITRAFVDAEFNEFPRKRRPKLAEFVTATEYAADIKTACAYPPQELHNTFGAYLADLGKTQLRIAETEKYAHVTFFFSGGQEELYPGEERILVPSPNVATYDLKPEMSAPEVTEKLVAAIKSGRYDAIICNYANGDMVGHTGIFAAAVQAAEAIDKCIEKIVAAVQETGGECLITADHGNAEMMVDPETNGIHTAHTCEPVPLIYVGPRKIALKPGTLPDIAPSLLTLMGLEQPKEMTGHSLVTILP